MQHNLLKIGSLNAPENRWLDATEVFNIVYVISLNKYRIKNDRIIFIDIFVNKVVAFFIGVIVRIVAKFKTNRISLWAIYLVRIVLYPWLRSIKKLGIDEVHCSYNDFDDSGFLLILLKPYLPTGVRTTRAYKEGRPEINFIEKKAFQLADRLVFSHQEACEFFKSKYPFVSWNKKDLIFGADEDVRSYKITQRDWTNNRLSQGDKRIHCVILAARVMSDANNIRSGARLYYVPLILELLSFGYVVHLHTENIVNDIYGENSYAKLQQQFPTTFYIEKPLDFDNDAVNAYKILSQYDYGILHNFIDGALVSEFDKYNIPHRFYEYHISGVIPILKRGTTKVLEELFVQQKLGVVYDTLADLRTFSAPTVRFIKPSFLEYITLLYSPVGLNPHGFSRF